MLSWSQPRHFPDHLWAELVQQCGGYEPREPRQRKYRAEVKHWKKDHPQVEIKSDFPSTNLLLVVALDGWETKYESRDHQWTPTRGLQVRMSSNASCGWTMDEFRELPLVAEEALAFLRGLQALKTADDTSGFFA